MSDFRLQGTKGTYRVSNKEDLPFAGNCGNKWLTLGSNNLMKQIGIIRIRVAVTDKKVSEPAAAARRLVHH